MDFCKSYKFTSFQQRNLVAQLQNTLHQKIYGTEGSCITYFTKRCFFLILKSHKIAQTFFPIISGTSLCICTSDRQSAYSQFRFLSAFSNWIKSNNKKSYTSVLTSCWVLRLKFKLCARIKLISRKNNSCRQIPLIFILKGSASHPCYRLISWFPTKNLWPTNLLKDHKKDSKSKTCRFVTPLVNILWGIHLIRLIGFWKSVFSQKKWEKCGEKTSKIKICSKETMSMKLGKRSKTFSLIWVQT